MARISEALTAYRICAKAEGRSPATVSWVEDAVRQKDLVLERRTYRNPFGPL